MQSPWSIWSSYTDYRAILNIRITHFTRQIFICIFPIKIGPNLSQQVRTGLTKPAPTFPTHSCNMFFRKKSRYFRDFSDQLFSNIRADARDVSHFPISPQREKVRRRLHLNFHLPTFFRILFPSPFPRDFHLHFRQKMSIFCTKCQSMFF